MKIVYTFSALMLVVVLTLGQESDVAGEVSEIHVFAKSMPGYGNKSQRIDHSRLIVSTSQVEAGVERSLQVRSSLSTMASLCIAANARHHRARAKAKEVA